MPYAKMNVCYSDYTGEEQEGILESDLKWEGIENEVNILTSSNWRRNKNSMEVEFGVSNSQYSMEYRQIGFHIDSLKFEKRRLLNAEEIQKLKKKYSITSEKVILWGSVNSSEIGLCLDNVMRLKEKQSKKRRTQTIIAPRQSPHDIIEKLRDSNINFTTDQELKKADCIVITKKGILDKLYSVCDIAILGEGQNPLEPAFYNKRTLVPHRGRNNDLAYEGLEKSGLLEIIDKSEIDYEIWKKISPLYLEICGERAQKFIASQQGAAKKYAKIIQLGLYDKMNHEEWRELINSPLN